MREDPTPVNRAVISIDGDYPGPDPQQQFSSHTHPSEAGRLRNGSFHHTYHGMHVSPIAAGRLILVDVDAWIRFLEFGGGNYMYGGGFFWVNLLFLPRYMRPW